MAELAKSEDHSKEEQLSQSSGDDKSFHSATEELEIQERQTAFPYLDTTALDDAGKIDLEERLKSDTRSIATKFSDFSLDVRRSLEVILQVPLERIKATLFSLNAGIQLFDPCDAEKIEKATSLSGVFITLYKYMSFYNYHIMERLVYQHGGNDDQLRLERYLSDFKEFCKRSIFQVPANVYSSQSRKEAKVLALKCTEKLAYLNALQDAVTLIASIFDLQPSALQLCSVKKGCVELRFLISSAVADHIFPVSPSKQSALEGMGVSVLSLEEVAPPRTETQLQGLSSADEVQSPPIQLSSNLHSAPPPPAEPKATSLPVPPTDPHATSAPTSDPQVTLPPAPPPLPSHPTKGDILDPDEFKSEDQVSRLTDTLKWQSCTIGVFFTASPDQAEKIASQLRGLLSGGNVRVLTHEMKKDGQHWLTWAKKEGVKFYVFVDFPSSRALSSSSSLERDFFVPLNDSGRRVNQIVFMDTKTHTSSQKSRIPKQLKLFLHLDGSIDADVLAQQILGHFAASQPVPFQSDRAYWSKVPKLLNVTKDKPALGLKLVTREMSPSSAFPRIALIKTLNDDCVPDLRNRVGRYTHIQSINGYLLDGLSIENVSAIFQGESSKETAQLMVRYIHSMPSANIPQTAPSAALPLDLTREDLPVPLFILSDNHKTASKLFEWLTTTDLGPPSSAASGSGVWSGASHRSETKGPFRKKTTWFSVESNDETIQRASISPSLSSPNYISPATPSPKPVFKSLVSNLASRCYIPQILSTGIDNRFAYTFFRTAGLYLITAWLNELVDNSLIQFENLSYWLRLIQQQTGCAQIKRVIIVCLYNGENKEDLPRIGEYMEVLNEALKEHKLHVQLFDQYNRVPRMSGKQGSYAFMFDVNQYTDSCYMLYSHIEQCMNLFAEKAYRFYPELFETVFKAFSGLNVALRELSSLKKIVASAEDLKSICEQKPDYALQTLQVYSPALIDSTSSDALLKPHFLIEMMTKLSTLSDDRDDRDIDVSNKLLKQLPIVSESWLSFAMEEIAATTTTRLTDHDKAVIMAWAERLGLMFKIEADTAGKSTFFVPSLAADMMGDMAKFYWDEKMEQLYDNDKATVLYAFLHFPATHHFFNRLLLVLIKEGVQWNRHNMYINHGCRQAIMPLRAKDGNDVFSVMTVYHPLQNVIAFKTIINVSKMVSFKEAVQDRLEMAYYTSPFHKTSTFSNAITFHIPSAKYDLRLVQSALWKFKEMELEQALEGEVKSDATRMLLKTRELQDMSNWAASHPLMKEIPSDDFLRWSQALDAGGKHWAQVGVKLKVLSTDDIDNLRTNPNSMGNGHEVLKRWQNSDLTVRDLVETLRHPDIGLESLAIDVEGSMLSGHDDLEDEMKFKLMRLDLTSLSGASLHHRSHSVSSLSSASSGYLSTSPDPISAEVSDEDPDDEGVIVSHV